MVERPDEVAEETEEVVTGVEKLEVDETIELVSDEDELDVEVVEDKAKYPETTTKMMITITISATTGVAIPLREENCIIPATPQRHILKPTSG